MSSASRLLGRAGEADEVGEEDGHEAALGCRRSGRGRCGLGVAAAASAAPHSPQNLAPGAFGVPHEGQALDSGLPHSPQNFRPVSFADPQAAHETVSDTRQL